MNRRDFLSLVGGGAAWALTSNAPAQAAARPNILFLFADDQCYEAVRALGNTEVETPNLDRLVRGGTTFTHAYNQGAWHGAVCVASRTMLVTGAFLWQAQALEKRLTKVAEQGLLWPQRMQAAGYETWFSGKWHVKTLVKEAFDTARHERPGMPNQTEAGYNRPIAGQEDPWSPFDPKFEGYWKGGKHWSEVLGDDGVDYLKAAAKREKPFFMYLAFNAPHDPRQSPKAYVDRYPLEKIATPANFLPEYPHKEAMGCGKDLRDERLAPFPRTEFAVKKNRQEYYAIITHMDAQIGRILDTLEATGQAENTWIFFTADHGLAVGHHGLMGKQNMFDHSLRVPLMVRGPGVAADKRIDTPVYLQDIMPTALELAGAETGGVAFNSLLPRLQGRQAGAYEAIYGAYMDRQRMICKDGYKLICYPKAGVWLLFNLQADPGETRNLAGDPAYADRFEQMKADLVKLQAAMGDPLPLPKAQG